MLTFCIIAFTNIKLAFSPCPAPDVIERMVCKVTAMSEYSQKYAICIDPKEKKIVYDGKVYDVVET